MKKDTPLTKREIKKAARLFTLMTIAQFDCGGMETDEQIDVLEKAVEMVRDDLAKEFPEIDYLIGSLSGCIEHIKGMRQ